MVKYYAIAREARIEAWKVRGLPGEAIWRIRLRECGIYVAAMLVYMKDYAAATEHLLTMVDSACADMTGNNAQSVVEEDQVDILQALVLVCLNTGDVNRMNEWMGKLTDKEADPIPLARPVEEAEHSKVELFIGKNDRQDANSSMVNLAIAYLYEGYLQTANKLLNKLIKAGYKDPNVLFSLCVLKELKREINRVYDGHNIEQKL